MDYKRFFQLAIPKGKEGDLDIFVETMIAIAQDIPVHVAEYEEIDQRIKNEQRRNKAKTKG